MALHLFGTEIDDCTLNTFLIKGASCHLQGLQEVFKLASSVHGDDDDDDCDENDANNQCRHCARIVGPGKWFICLALIVPRNNYQKDHHHLHHHV